MTRQHGDCIVQGKKLASDPAQEKVLVAKRKVPPTDTLAKERVSTDDNVFVQKVKAQAAGAVSRNMVNMQARAEEFDRAFVEEEIRCERVDVQAESPVAKKVAVADHGDGVGMEGGFAAVALDYGGAVGDMIEVSMGEQQQVNLFASEGGVCALRSVEKNFALWRLIGKTIGVESTAGKGFEPIHEKMVREVMSRFDFRRSVCKLLTFSI